MLKTSREKINKQMKSKNYKYHKTNKTHSAAIERSLVTDQQLWTFQTSWLQLYWQYHVSGPKPLGRMGQTVWIDCHFEFPAHICGWLRPDASKMATGGLSHVVWFVSMLSRFQVACQWFVKFDCNLCYLIQFIFYLKMYCLHNSKGFCRSLSTN